MKRIPIAGPWISQKEIDTVTDAVATSWYEGAGKYEQLFERSFAEYLGVSHAVSLPHCTSAIHLSLLALGVGYGDEVIVPANTYIATWLAVSYAGAVPVPVEPNPHTYNLDPEKVEVAITPKTKAILPVHLYGQTADMDSINFIAKKHHLNGYSK